MPEIKTQNRGISVEKAKARTDSQLTGRLWEDFPLIRSRLTLTRVDLKQKCKWWLKTVGDWLQKWLQGPTLPISSSYNWACSSPHHEVEFLSLSFALRLTLRRVLANTVCRNNGEFPCYVQETLHPSAFSLHTLPPPRNQHGLVSLREQSFVMSAETILKPAIPSQATSWLSTELPNMALYQNNC